MIQGNKKEFEEENNWSIGKILTAILLLPLLPYYLIYKLRIDRRIRGLLILGYFVIMLVVYQVACDMQGPTLRKVLVENKKITINTPTQFVYTTNPSKIKETKVVYKSYNPTVATVSKDGLITPITNGKCKVTVWVTDNHYTTERRSITVYVNK